MIGVEVHLRSADSTSSQPLCEVPFGTDLEQLVSWIRKWGVSDADGEHLDTDTLVGEFVVGSGRPYFSLVIES